MKILITGSKGCIGSVLTQELKNRNHIVFELDRSHAANEHAFTMGYAPDGNYFKCDIGEFRQLQRIIDFVKPEIVYHLAAECGRWDGEDFYEDVWKTNAIGTKNLLRLQHNHKYKIVFFSSSEIYSNYNDIMYENVPDLFSVAPLNDYGISKWVNELQIRNSSTKDDCLILRLFNIYGPGEIYSPYRSFICRLVYSCLKSLPFTVFNGRRSHTYVGDAVNAMANISDIY